MCKMTKAQLEEENRNLKFRLERISSLVSDVTFDQYLAKQNGQDYYERACLSYGRIVGSIRFYSSADEDGVYSKVY